jgi:hypothetical protein
MSNGDEYSVALWFPDGSYMYEARWLSAGAAVRLAKRCTERPAAAAGFIDKVMITDGGDNTVFLWEHNRGVVFPLLGEKI